MRQPPAIPLSLQRHPEEQLHRSVVDHLRGVLVGDRYLGGLLPAGAVLHHSPNGGRRSKREGAVFKALGTHAGWSDLEVCYQGQVYFIELKAETGRLSADQKRCHKELRDTGMLVAVCKSLEEVEGTLAAWGIPLMARIPVTGEIR